MEDERLVEKAQALDSELEKIEKEGEHQLSQQRAVYEEELLKIRQKAGQDEEIGLKNIIESHTKKLDTLQVSDEKKKKDIEKQLRQIAQKGIPLAKKLLLGDL